MNFINKKTALLSCFAATSLAVNAADERPNILWVMIEDWSTDMGCYGTAGVETPVFDKLAADGMLFTDAYTTAPVSSAARSAMMTGYYQNFIGGNQHREHNKQPLPYGIRPIPQLMEDAGYHTHLACWKTDLNFGPYEKEDIFMDTRDWKDHKPGEKFFGVGCEEGQPFFTRITFGGTHRAWSRDAVRPIETGDVELPPYYADTEYIRRDWANGLEQLQITDREVGELLDQLEKDGYADNTLVIFLGDNGRCHIRGKQFLYEPGTKVPMIIRWPGKVEPGTVNNDLVMAIDIAPTCAEIAGAKSSIPFQGQDIFGKKISKREYVFTARDKMDETHDAMRAIRSKDGYKLIHNLMPERPYLTYNQYKEGGYPPLAEMMVLFLEGKLTKEQAAFFAPTKPEYELFDLNKDPHEIKNLADDPSYAKIKAELIKELTKWQKMVNDKGVTEEFRADGAFPKVNPEESVDAFVFKNHDKYDFNKYGWPIWYPTRSLEEWKEIRNAWVPYIFRKPGTEHARPDIIKDYKAKQEAKAAAKAKAASN
ncbi:MAG: sulfatase [Rikenellaceae bacterium]